VANAQHLHLANVFAGELENINGCCTKSAFALCTRQDA
jgi:hypothetical protein